MNVLARLHPLHEASQRELGIPWLRVAAIVGLGGAGGAIAAFVNGRSAPAATERIVQAATLRSAQEKPSAGSRAAQLAVVRAQRAAMRQAPSASSAIVCEASHGTQLLIDGAAVAWCRVKMADGPPCYVARTDISLTGVRVEEDVPDPEPVGRVDVVAEARRHLGSRYVWGGATEGGSDCSGFVQMVFAGCGVALPRAAAGQANVGFPVLAAELRPGDRVYFRARNGSIHHTGIYVGDGRFIHASSRHGRVVISSLDDHYYVGQYAFARR